MTEEGGESLRDILKEIIPLFSEDLDFTRTDPECLREIVQRLTAAAAAFNLLAIKDLGGRLGPEREPGLVEHAVGAAFQNCLARVCYTRGTTKGVTIMARQLKKIHVIPGSELERLLEEATVAPLILEKNGERYRLNREEEKEDIWAGYDPELVQRALKRSAGTLAHVNREVLLADLRKQREQNTHGRPA